MFGFRSAMRAASGNSIVRKLRDQAMDESVSVATLLRTAKVVATNLDQHDALIWIEHELNGYPSDDDGVLPEFRQLHQRVQGFDPYRGWLPVVLGYHELDEMISKAPVAQSVVSIEKTLRSLPKERELVLRMHPGRENLIREAIQTQVPIQAVVDRNAIFSILDAVRNLVLDWALKLEKANIMGEVVLTEHDKLAASRITQTFIAQNINVVGDGSIVKNTQTASVSLDIEAVRNFVEEARLHLSALPPQTASAIEPALREIDDELSAKKPNEGKLRGAISSIRAIAENAGGGLLASGIVAAAAALLGE